MMQNQEPNFKGSNKWDGTNGEVLIEGPNGKNRYVKINNTRNNGTVAIPVALPPNNNGPVATPVALPPNNNSSTVTSKLKVPQTTWFYFIILLVILLSVLTTLVYGLGIADVSKNWAANRCKPSIMPFAALYGYNTADNFHYCMTNMIQTQASGSLNPIYQILGTFVGTISTLISSANSMRLSLATMVGGITKVFQEFAERMNTLMVRIRVSSVRMKILFSRLFATFNAMIFMGLSGITAANNLGDTVLFAFLDTFCFDPDTLVLIEGKGSIPVKDVEIGDIFTKAGSKVTAKFRFYSDGQPMVRIGNILVSTNHYVQSKSGVFLKAADHEDAIPADLWAGGLERPLICFNTDKHTIPIGDYTFLDYDETETADKPTMIYIENTINGKRQAPIQTREDISYTPGFHETTHIALPDGKFMAANKIQLGQKISTGKIVGIVQKKTDKFIRLGNDLITAGSLVWDKSSEKWVRAYTLNKPLIKKECNAYSFIVSPNATIETRQGTHIRDYMELMSPDAEIIYAKEIAVLFSEGAK